jgi:hypothetical protein
MSKFTDRLREIERADLDSVSDYARGWNDAAYRTREDMRTAADLLDEAEKALAGCVDLYGDRDAMTPAIEYIAARPALIMALVLACIVLVGMMETPR